MSEMIIIGHGSNIKQTIRDIRTKRYLLNLFNKVKNKNIDIQPIEVNTLIQQEEQKQQSMIQRLKDFEIEILTKEKLLKQQKDQKTYTYRDINRKTKGFRKKKGKYYG